MSKLGLHLGYYPARTDWLQIAAIASRRGLSSIVALDGFDLPQIRLTNIRCAYRPLSEIPRAIATWDPWVFAWYIRYHWQEKGSRYFDDLIFQNEPNREEESGTRDWHLIVWWCLECIKALRYHFPGKLIHNPPLTPSPTYGSWQEHYMLLAPVIAQCDILDCHDYLTNRVDLAWLHSHFPTKPIYISECGDQWWGSAEYGRAMLEYFDGLPDYVVGAADYIFTAPDGDWDAWRKQSTDTVRVWTGEIQ